MIRCAHSLPVVTLSLVAFASPGCSRTEPPPTHRTLTLAAYTTPREVYGEAIIPAFQQLWKERTGEAVEIQQSYLGSGAQSRAILGGFEADVAALSLEPDIERLVESGLITHDWRQRARGGMVTRSIVAIAVRPDNPLTIQGWDDLGADGLEVLTPNVRTSGGAMWNVAAITGAALRGRTSAEATTEGAEQLLASILRNVRVMDKGARESILNFEQGLGDAAITYENEVLAARLAGRTMDMVIPPSTILIENPVAIIDVSVERHDNRDLAEAFVDYLVTPEAQAAFARFGFRPVDESAAHAAPMPFPPVEDLFTIRDLGGWDRLHHEVFEPQALYDRAHAAALRSTE